MEQKNKQITGLSIIVVGLLIFLLSVTYAFINMQLTGTKKQIITAGNLELELLEGDSITIENALPMYDEVGLIQEPFNFTLHNKLDEVAKYKIILEDITEEEREKLDKNLIRYALEKDGKLQKGTLGGIENLVLEEGRISGYQTIHYKLRLWIDSSVEQEETIKEKTLSYRINIEAEPVLTAYTDPELDGADPVLSKQLVPIVVQEDGTVKKADYKDAWYDYKNQKWANTVVLVDKTKEYKNQEIIPKENIESYFVWIPRYRYKIFNSDALDQTSELSFLFPQTIEIEFQSKERDASEGTQTGEWLTHPAFLAFDSNGFWVGKFETGYKALLEDEDEFRQSSNITIKPDVFSWRNTTVEMGFTLSYNYLRSDESHMMKNTEWGAVAYLQHSIYGSEKSVRTNNNNTGKTGYAASKEPTLGYNIGTSLEGNENGNSSPITIPFQKETGYIASTTGNITGIYDMAGGAAEYVMGYNESATVVGGASLLKKVYPDFFENDAWRKYYDLYTNETLSDTMYTRRILGDATGEMGPFQDVTDPDGVTRHISSWYKDLASFVTPNNSWFVRGGNWMDGSEAGIFAFSNATGGSYAWNSFRIVLTPSK